MRAVKLCDREQQGRWKRIDGPGCTLRLDNSLIFARLETRNNEQMRTHTRTTRRTVISRISSLAMLLLAGTFLGAAGGAQGQTGAVFTSTNSSVANSVVMFQRAADGALTPFGEFFTGGVGTGSGLGNAGAVILSQNKKWLFTVNAGSNEISVFAVKPNDLILVDRVPSGGNTPVSLTVFGDWLYVVNAGTPSSITGFWISGKGRLTPIANSTQPLSLTTVKPGQIKFNPYGNLLVVTEQTTNMVDVFPVQSNGAVNSAIFSPSAGTQPFGFDFDGAGHLLVSEAAGSSASSYYVSIFGILPISEAVANGQKAACWLVTNNLFAWTANAASDDISAYTVAPSGQLSLISSQGGVAVQLPPGSHPTDEAIDGHGHLYVLDANPGAITALGVNSDGTLAIINTTAGFGAGMSGIAAK